MGTVYDGPIPERELAKAYGLGKAARAQGKTESACPFFLPRMREEWFRGFREGEA